jgi:hypothetical protein
VILYQMVTGALPFNADSPIGFVTAHLNDAPVPPRDRRPEVSLPMEALILRTLNKNRDGRPASAKAMWSELIAIGRGEDPEPPTDVYHVNPVRDGLAAVALTDKVRRTSPLAVPTGLSPTPRSRFGLVAGALGLLVVAGGAFAAYRWSPSKLADPPAAAAPAPPAAAPAVDSTALYTEAKTTFFAAHPAKDTEEGREKLKHALSLAYKAYKSNPAEPAPLKIMGLCNADLGNTQDAIDNYEQYVKTQPPPPDVASIRNMLAALRQDTAGK